LDNHIRRTLSYLVVGSWAVSILFVLTIIVFGLVDMKQGFEILKNFSSISSGFVGVIIGYYFTNRNQ